MDSFFKNLSIMGGFLLLYITGAGKYSIDVLFSIATPYTRWYATVNDTSRRSDAGHLIDDLIDSHPSLIDSYPNEA